MAARSWRAELLPQGAYHAAYTPAAPIIGFAFDGQGGVHAFGGDRRTDFQAKPNGLAYVPAGCDVYSQSDHGGEYLRITFEWEAFERGAPSSRRFSDAIDPAASDAAHRLRRILLSPHTAEPLSGEHLVHTLKDRAWEILTGRRTELAPASSMTPRRLRIVDELIEAKLDTKITVQQLANSLGLSAGFFARAFKAAIGKAPHDYIVDRRVSRARTLLRHAGLDLSAIAHASGFASHAHMTATFNSRLGVSPSDLRSSLLKV